MAKSIAIGQSDKSGSALKIDIQSHHREVSAGTYLCECFGEESWIFFPSGSSYGFNLMFLFSRLSDEQFSTP